MLDHLKHLRVLIPSLLLTGLVGICAAPLSGVGNDSSWRVDWQVRLGVSSTRLVVPSRLDRPIVDEYPGPNWHGAQLDPQAARAWDSLPAVAELQVRVQNGGFTAFTALPVRRDAESWMVDPTHSNLPLSPAQLDINVPYQGWAQWKHPYFQTRLGRFALDSLFDPRGVILAGTPHHDGLWWQWGNARWKYTFLWSSLNPWLHGTPIDSNLEPPVGSESWQQAHLSISNQRNRIYNQPHKNLLVHCLALERPRFSVAIVELLLVGGKALDLRDANPFAVWHNNYGDGYSKSSTGLEGQWHSPTLGQFSAQVLLQDVRSGVGEQLGVDHRVIGASYLGWRQSWGLWAGEAGLNVTSPTFENHRIPLLRMTSRRIYRSNHRLQVEPNFVDNFIADYPLDYTRGGDCVDLLTHVQRAIPSKNLVASAQWQWLQRGDARTYPTFDSMDNLVYPLNGVVEREHTGLVSVQWREKPWNVLVQTGLSRIENAGNVRKTATWNPLWNLELTWTR